MEKTEKIENDELIAVDNAVTGIESDLAEVEPTPPQIATVLLEVQNGYIGTTAKRI